MIDTSRSREARLLLEAPARQALWSQLAAEIEDYLQHVEDAPVTPAVDRDLLRSAIAEFDFERPVEPERALRRVADAMRRFNVQPAHPNYYGLFNPAPTTMGIAADALAAAFNPQLATWSHAPFAVEAEAHLVRYLARRFGYDPGSVEGTFTTGGAESNFTAIVAALADREPEYAREGVRAFPAPPVIYASALSHHSVIKGSRAAGLGTAAVRHVPVDGLGRMDVAMLVRLVEEDRARGRLPLMIVATLGTTGIGAIDPIAQMAEQAAAGRLWLHVDAAWGGLAAFVPGLRDLLEGVPAADSLTFDAHKGLSVPMGASVYITRHRGLLGRAFAISTDYMPRAVEETADPYAHSFQWSRRFIGLKLLLTLAVAGGRGYEAALTGQVSLGDALRESLRSEGWSIENDTPLPLVCFTDGKLSLPLRDEAAVRVADAVVRSGQAWVSVVDLPDGRRALRACITNYRTQSHHVEELVAALQRAR